MKNDKGLMERVKILERQVREIAKILDELDKRIKDIDMDVNALFDDVEGTIYENNNKQLNTNK